MIDPKAFLEILTGLDIDFFTGVPDSLLKSFNQVLPMNPRQHLIAANEGNAIALGIGHYLATQKLPCIYMQNSGFGNAVNPLLSTCVPSVYGIPMLLLIGWRGQPNIKDEPQHVHVGKTMLQSLEAMEIPFQLLSPEFIETKSALEKACRDARQHRSPFALIVPKDFFAKTSQETKQLDTGLTREQALKIVASHAPANAKYFATTGHLGRELYEHRQTQGQPHHDDFLNIGSMGHCSQIALGFHLGSKKPTVCLDGDGALLMHLGALAICGQYAHAQHGFYHILFNNGVHDSVGAQPTVGHKVDWSLMAKACGYESYVRVEDEQGLVAACSGLFSKNKTCFIEIMIQPGARKDLGRPTQTPTQSLSQFLTQG